MLANVTKEVWTRQGLMEYYGAIPRSTDEVRTSGMSFLLRWNHVASSDFLCTSFQLLYLDKVILIKYLRYFKGARGVGEIIPVVYLHSYYYIISSLLDYIITL